MALVLISCLVLGPLAILVVDVIRGISGRDRESAPGKALQVDEDGYRIRAPRPSWPAPSAAPGAAVPQPVPARGFRPTGGRQDYFGDGLLDRTS